MLFLSFSIFLMLGTSLKNHSHGYLDLWTFRGKRNYFLRYGEVQMRELLQFLLILIINDQ